MCICVLGGIIFLGVEFVFWLIKLCIYLGCLVYHLRIDDELNTNCVIQYSLDHQDASFCGALNGGDNDWCEQAVFVLADNAAICQTIPSRRGMRQNCEGFYKNKQ